MNDPFVDLLPLNVSNAGLAATKVSNDSCSLKPLPGMNDPFVFFPPLNVSKAGFTALAVSGIKLLAAITPPNSRLNASRRSMVAESSVVVVVLNNFWLLIGVKAATAVAALMAMTK